MGGGNRVSNKPLAPQQRGMWFLQQLRPESTQYNLQVCLRMRGVPDTEALRASLDLIGRRHDPIRSTIGIDDGGSPFRTIHSTPAPLCCVKADDGGEDEARRWIESQLERPFRLDRELPVRWLLVELSPEDHLLLMTFHHVAVDGVSLEIVATELCVAYNAIHAGQTPELPPLPLDFDSVARFESTCSDNPAALEQLRRRLGGLDNLDLPADRSCGGVGGGLITVRRSVSESTVMALRSVARKAEGSLFAVALTAYGLMLSRTGGSSDFAIGMPVSGRSQPGTENLIGCLFNTVCVRMSFRQEDTVLEAVRRTSAALVEAVATQDIPFSEVVRVVAPERDSARNPIFSAFCSSLDAEPAMFMLDGLQTEWVVPEYQVARFDVNATFALGMRQPSIQMEFSRELFETRTAERLIDRLIETLDWVGADPTCRMSDVNIMPLRERREVLEILNGGR